MTLSKAEVICYLIAVVGFFTAHVLWEAPFWLLYVTVGGAAVLAFFFNRRQEKTRDGVPVAAREKYISPYRVAYDERQVTVSINGNPQGAVLWQDLIYVGIRIMNQGFIDVPYWLLADTSGNVSYPSDALGNEAMLDEMQKRLPGFNHRAVIGAMGSTAGGWTAWERPLESQSSPGPT